MRRSFPLVRGRWFGAAALMMAFALPLSAQQGTVTGQVTDEQSGEPIAGAQVSLVDTGHGALSGENGRYTISNVPAGTYTVQVTFLGRADARQTGVQVAAGETTTVNFVMRARALRLEGVVATGVVDPIEGVRMPFSVGRLTAADMPVRGTHSALAVLQGRVAGVHINRPSGEPGSGVNIMLRSPTSTVRNNSPLYVVDGVILGTTFGGTTLDIDPGDIESIEVVKGAAAAALYGSRAAGGVISITTDRGRDVAQGSTRISVRSEYGFERPPNTQGFLAQHHYFQMDEAGQYFIDADGNPINPPEGMGSWGDRVLNPDRMLKSPYPTATPFFDNVDRFFTNQGTASNSLRLAHNAQNTNFVVSMNHYVQEGVIANVSGYEQANFRLNLDHRLHDNLSISATAYHNRGWRDNLSSSGNMFWDLTMTDPVFDLTRRDPVTGEYIMQPDPTSNLENPLWRQSTRENRWWRARTQVSTMADFRPVSWFRMDGNVSYDRSDITDQIYVPKGVQSPTTDDSESLTDGRLYLRDTTTDVINAALSATFLQQWGDLDARLTLRGTTEREDRTRFSGDGRDFWVRDVRDMSIGQDQYASSDYIDIRAMGYLAQMGFLWSDKYTFDFLLRRDGSSLFGPDNRWDNNYRFSGAWRMAQEDWWPMGLGFFTEFKPRFSQGTAGGRPNFSDQYETWSVSSGGGVSKGTLGNRFLGPERTTEREAGLDMIIDDRFQLELTYATQTTTDQIIQIPQPAPTGYSNRWMNSGEITGTTYELTFQALMVQRPGFTWDMTMIADRTTSEITEWNRPCYFTGTGGMIHRCLGANRSQMWGQRHLLSHSELPEWHQGSESAFDVNDEGFLVAVGEGGSWRDGNWGERVTIDGINYTWGLPIIQVTEDGDPDIVPIGDGWPDLNLGFLNQFRWRNFTLHSHLHAEIGRENYNERRQRMYQHVRHSNLDQAGKPEERQKPIDYYWQIYNIMNNTEYFVEDGTYLKLRELQVRYNLQPQQVQRFGLSRLGLERAAVGLVGRNLLTFTNYSGFDPEVGSGSQVFRETTGSYPQTRQFTFEVELTF